VAANRAEAEFQKILAEDKHHDDAWERLCRIVGRLTARPERPL
jgi:ferric-dicitrate binding protein FerR (iron transport regulator)